MSKNMYAIIECNSLESLSTEVCKWLHRGWDPHSGPFAIPTRVKYTGINTHRIENHYGQAMIKIDRTEPTTPGARELVRRMKDAGM